MSAQFTQVSVVIEANVLFDGRWTSHTLLFEDGSQKMLGVIQANDETLPEYEIKTDTSERIEIVSGECEVKIAGKDEYECYRPGQSFMVAGDSSFYLRTEKLLQYICHLEG